MDATELIKAHEGLRLEAYRCGAGVWTIGWGHTLNVHPGMRITLEQAEGLLANDVASVKAQLGNMMLKSGVKLAPNRRDALTSFAFNVGIDALRRSTLWRKVTHNADDPAIAAEFARWKYAGGRIMPGLVRRRADEAALYFAQ